MEQNFICPLCEEKVEKLITISLCEGDYHGLTGCWKCKDDFETAMRYFNILVSKRKNRSIIDKKGEKI